MKTQADYFPAAFESLEAQMKQDQEQGQDSASILEHLRKHYDNQRIIELAFYALAKAYVGKIGSEYRELYRVAGAALDGEPVEAIEAFFNTDALSLENLGGFAGMQAIVETDDRQTVRNIYRKWMNRQG